MNSALAPIISILLLAACFAVLMKRLGQPLLLGYVLTGIVAGPFGLAWIQKGESLELFSTLGISLLLFLVGLGLNPSYIRDVGPVAVITGLAQIVFTTIFGWLIAIALGFSSLVALYVALAFTFSSTIIVLRLLQDKGEEDTLYGRIAIGFLLVQDLVAMIIFLLLSASNRTESWSGFGLLLGVKFVAIGVVAWLFVRYILPRIELFLADDRELLMLSSLAWCLSCAWVFSTIGFSSELGALFAGVTLSFSTDFREIATRVTPLRDFFLILFFVAIGANLAFDQFQSLWPAIVIFSAFILIGNPLILYLIMVGMGYARQTAFYVGLTVAQISEFSLILITIGIKLGHIGEQALVLTTSVGLITIAVSSLMVAHNDKLYRWFTPLLARLTPKAKAKETTATDNTQPVDLLLFGAHRLGGGILTQAQELGVRYLVVDIDPHLVHQLQSKQVLARFGSADDPVLLDSLNVSQLKLVISTIPNTATNLFLVTYMRKHVPKASLIVVAQHPKEAQALYEAGADYVVMPTYLGRRFMVDLFKKNVFDHTKYQNEAEHHRRDLDYLIDL